MNQDLGIIENIPFSKDSYYKYDNEYLRCNAKRLDSSRSYIYTNVEPSDKNKKYRRQIYTSIGIPYGNKEDGEYFYKTLKSENLSFIEMNNKIVFRDFYKEYTGKDYYKPDINKPRNKEDLIKYFKNKKADYKIIRTKKSENADIVEARVNGNYYKIIVHSTFCKSYLYYNEKDTVCNYSTIIYTFF